MGDRHEHPLTRFGDRQTDLSDMVYDARSSVCRGGLCGGWPVDQVLGVPETVAGGGVRPGRAPRLDSLTGLRWFAAFAVFGFHLTTSPEVTADSGVTGVLKALFRSGASGVTFFFILSGLVLTWSARAGDRPAAFWRRRVARVMPNHVVVWIGVLAVLAVTGKAVGAGPSVTGLVLLQAWVPDQVYYFAGNTPAWSLSCEMVFYAAFPLLLPLLSRVPGRRLWQLAVGLPVAIALVPVVSLAMPYRLAYWFVWVFPVPRALDFALGMVIALLIKEGRWRGPGLAVSAVLVLVCYAVEPLVPQRWTLVAWMVVPFALLIAAAASADVEGRPSWLRWRGLVWLGEISFAFYLVHQPVIRFGAKALGSHASAPMIVAGIVVIGAVAVGAAALLYRAVERPMERRLARRR